MEIGRGYSFANCCDSDFYNYVCKIQGQSQKEGEGVECENDSSEIWWDFNHFYKPCDITSRQRSGLSIIDLLQTLDLCQFQRFYTFSLLNKKVFPTK